MHVYSCIFKLIKIITELLIRMRVCVVANEDGTILWTDNFKRFTLDGCVTSVRCSGANSNLYAKTLYVLSYFWIY